MRILSWPTSIMRRTVLRVAVLGVSGVMGARAGLGAEASGAEYDDLILRLIGGAASVSPRVRLQIPAVFSNGAGVPMTLAVESPMTEVDHVRRVHVLAPRNPIIPVATFQFTPQSGRAMISTRIRLSEPQDVIAVAELSDGTLLQARTWVAVDTNGCT